MAFEEGALAEIESQSSAPVESAPEGQAEVEAPQEAAPFHTWKDRDGKDHVFKTPEELNDHISQGTLRHADYTQKTQGIAETRKLLDQQRKSYEDKERELRPVYTKHMDWDKRLKTDPQLYADLEARISRTGDPQADMKSFFDGEIAPLKEELAGYKREREQRASDDVRAKAFEAVAGKYQDFDRGTIDAAIQRIEEVPAEMKQQALVELLYHAEKGRMTPGAIERKAAMTAAKPRSSTPTASVGIPDKQVSAMSREEEMETALAAMKAAAG